ncbi:MAG: SH3 domain-containing protein [Gammaproteobacteria bacterium]|nr:SH3 domain-containing protein [Gammaproteobacteria bacterium]
MWALYGGRQSNGQLRLLIVKAGITARCGRILRKECRYLFPGLCLWLLSLVAWPAVAGELVKVWVAEPYLELHTGPGRGYPVFYIAERGEVVEIIRQHTDWFEVRTARDKEGWVPREQMETTLTEEGTQKTFGDVLLQDFLNRRVEAGFSYGRLESVPILTAHAGFRFHENLLVELAVAEATGQFSTTSLYYVSLTSQPYPDARFSPFFTLGMGRFENQPKATLVDAHDTKADLANVGIGARYYLTRRFVARADLKNHVVLVDHDRTDTYKEWSLGISFFF